MKNLPSHLQEPLQRFIHTVSTQLSSELHGLILYGGVLRGRHHAGSDVNLLIILKRTSLDILTRLEKPLTAARRRFNLAPFILELGELERIADVYPIKLNDILRHHQIVWGSEPLPDIKVSPEHVRLHLEQGLRNLQLRLRRHLAEHASDRLSLRQHYQTMTRPLAIHLAELLILNGECDVPEDTAGVFARAHARWNLPALAPLAELRQNDGYEPPDWTELGDLLLAGLQTIIQHADRMEMAE